MQVKLSPPAPPVHGAGRLKVRRWRGAAGSAARGGVVDGGAGRRKPRRLPLQLRAARTPAGRPLATANKSYYMQDDAIFMSGIWFAGCWLPVSRS